MLREADRTSVAAASKANGVSEQSIYTWRKQYRGRAVDEVRRLRRLEQEIALAACGPMSARASVWLSTLRAPFAQIA